ncbi:hypothetical protein FRX31_022277 [Thalictrum thalictroides]|uniref:Uncharacterized protein n=1 Tax=Thalictrum thalictroides TaxID=46969 RepID=A0A7J6VTP2_THATH|nr:hypothetical protein FRX31_022277 [Thalictrum thalictroides]
MVVWYCGHSTKSGCGSGCGGSGCGNMLKSGGCGGCGGGDSCGNMTKSGGCGGGGGCSGSCGNMAKSGVCGGLVVVAVVEVVGIWPTLVDVVVGAGGSGGCGNSVVCSTMASCMLI